MDTSYLNLFKITRFICGVTLFTIFATFKTTDYNEKLVVSNKSLSLKAPTI